MCKETYIHPLMRYCATPTKLGLTFVTKMVVGRGGEGSIISHCRGDGDGGWCCLGGGGSKGGRKKKRGGTWGVLVVIWGNFG